MLSKSRRVWFLTIALLLGVVLILSTAACSSKKQSSSSSPQTATPSAQAPKAPEPIVINLATAVTRPFIGYVAIDDRKEQLEKNSGGRIKVVLHEGTLGGESESYERLKMGTLEAYSGSTGTLEQVTGAGVILAFNTPYLFQDWDHLFRALGGDFGKIVTDALVKGGIRPVGWGSIGGRQVYYKGKKPGVTPKDLAGMKIRVMETPTFIAYYKALGVIPVPMAWNEVYTALQMGTIDGSDTTLTSAYGAKHHELVSFVSITDHVIAPDILTVSEKWFQKLPADLQKIVADTAAAASKKEHQFSLNNQVEMEKKWEAAGVKVVRPDRTAFRDAAKTIWPQFQERIGSQAMAAIDATAKK